MDIPVAANVLGTLGAVCWSIQVLPLPSARFTATQTAKRSISAHTPDYHQLPPSQCHWTSAHYDDAMGVGRRPFGSVQYCRGVQYRSEDTAANLDIAELGDVDPVLLL